MCFTVGILLLVAGISDVMAPIIVAIGFIMGLLSVGKDVKVSEGLFELKYGFSVAVIKYAIKNVVDVFNINSLSRGKLVKYFKYHLFIFSLIIALPIIYLVIKGFYPNLAYLPFLFLPVFLGVILQLYMSFTAESYRKLISKLTIAPSTAWDSVGFVVGATYREYYGQSLFSNITATTLYFIGTLLLAVSTIVLLSILSKHHIVIIETSNNKFYAIGTSTPSDAEELLRLILKEVVGYVETSA